MRSVFVLAIFTLLLSVSACGDSNYLEWASDDTSKAACEHALTLNLDRGYYDLVIGSSCTNYMDTAAAYLGKAGYDVTTIIDSMIEANDASSKSFSVYMNKLIANVSNADIQHLDYSRDYFSLVNSSSGFTNSIVRDAIFYGKALIGPLISYAYIKSSIDPDGDGALSDCDLNGNGDRDEVDASGCALLLAGGDPNCDSLGLLVNTATYQTVSFSGLTGVYNGVEMTFGGVTNASCPDDKQYKLLYEGNKVAVTSLEKCVDSNFPLISWNCPYEDSGGRPVSLLTSFNEAMQDATGALDSMGFDPDSEVYMAVNDVSTDACNTGPCTEQELQTYLGEQLGQ